MKKSCLRGTLLGLLTISGTQPAGAREIFFGIYNHGVDTPFSLETGEKGVDVESGYRFEPIEALSALGDPAPYVLASLNTRGDTSFGGVGLAWRIGKGPLFARPGFGLIIHDGPDRRIGGKGKFTDLGSRVLFEPEFSLGYRLHDRFAVEASWVHISHAGLFNRVQNPGIDMFGFRFTLQSAGS